MNLAILLQASGGDHVLGLILIIIGILFYFVPALAGRGKRNASSIFILNLLLGWTLIGWVIAFVWALSKDDVPVVVNQVAAPAPAAPTKTIADQLTTFKQLLDSGAITQEEFDEQKRKLLNA